MKIPWSSLEREARRRAGREVAALRRLTNRTLQLCDVLLRLRRIQSTSELSQVRAAILSQVVLTARAVTVLVANGYPLQAMAQLASLYELTAALAYAGKSPDRAREWSDHDSERETYPPSRDRPKAIRELLVAGGFSGAPLEQAVKAWEARYRNYCMAKHGNPKVLKHYGVRRTAKAVAINLGPIAGGPYTDLMQLALLRTSQLVVMAATVYGQRESAEGFVDLSVNAGRLALRVAQAVADASASMSSTD